MTIQNTWHITSDCGRWCGQIQCFNETYYWTWADWPKDIYLTFSIGECKTLTEAKRVMRNQMKETNSKEIT